MSPDPGDYQHLTLEGGRLTALKELPFHGSEFESACRQLFLADAPELVIDLTRLRYVASPQIGALVATCRRAAEAGRVLRVLIRPALERFLGRMKVDGLIDYELVEGAD
jgi:anti-anti-sigma regulatory factor